MPSRQQNTHLHTSTTNLQCWKRLQFNCWFSLNRRITHSYPVMCEYLSMLTFIWCRQIMRKWHLSVRKTLTSDELLSADIRVWGCVETRSLLPANQNIRTFRIWKVYQICKFLQIRRWASTCSVGFPDLNPDPRGRVFRYKTRAFKELEFEFSVVDAVLYGPTTLLMQDNSPTSTLMTDDHKHSYCLMMLKTDDVDWLLKFRDNLLSGSAESHLAGALCNTDVSRLFDYWKIFFHSILVWQILHIYATYFWC